MILWKNPENVYVLPETVYVTPGVQVFVPQGVCNGFQALGDTEYLYVANYWRHK